MKSYKRNKSKTKMKSKTRPLTIKKKSKNRVNISRSIKRSHNKINKSENWDVLVHAIVNPLVLQYIAKDKILKPSDKEYNSWLFHKKTKKKFGDYFNYGNNRYNVIKLLTKNINKLDSLKSKQNIKKSYHKELNNNNIKLYYHTPAVYTTYIFSETIYNEDTPFYGRHPPIIFLISSKILKDKPFIFCNSMMYGHCIRNFKYLEKGFYGKGNLKIKPSMKEFKEFINNKILKSNERLYSSTHEIMFDNIPLKYVNAILYNDKKFSYEELREFFPQKHINIVKLPTKEFINEENKIEYISDFTNYKKLLEPYSY